MLDEALDFRGNFYFGAVSACCIGCVAWQRCFILLPRWALTMACVSLVRIRPGLDFRFIVTIAASCAPKIDVMMQVSTYSPWAFAKNLADLGSAGGKPSAAQSQPVHITMASFTCVC